MTDPSKAILIINTNVKHELTGGEYANAAPNASRPQTF